MHPETYGKRKFVALSLWENRVKPRGRTKDVLRDMRDFKEGTKKEQGRNKE